ncbi:hypothetical protein SJAV_20730 [Sulfurisphaera javensis]|uniref:Thermopsin n=1 Tax=Sulfurisphaera javensis TaxID=2049879 RepID=A0AAT9GT85_9CREN
MVSSIILFAFLIPGMIFSYTLSSSSLYVSHNQYFYYNDSILMKWEDTHFNMTVFNNLTVTTISPKLPPYHNVSVSSYNVLTYYDIYYSPYYLPIIAVLSNFSIINYPVNVNGSNVTVPAIKFYDNGGGYMIVSAQYGFPISVYNKTFENGIKFNFSVRLNYIQSPSPLNFVKSSNLYKVKLNFLIGTEHKYEEVYVISPSSSFAYGNIKLGNQTFPALNISAHGYVAVILPISEFPYIEPSGNIYVNGSIYSILLQQLSSDGYFYWSTTYEYQNKSFPFIGAMIGHYYVMFFPEGGDISIIFINSGGEIVGVTYTTPVDFSQYILIGGISIAVILVIVAVLKKRGVF